MIKLLKKFLNLNDNDISINDNAYLPIKEVIKLHRYKLASFLIDDIRIEYKKEDAFEMLEIIENKFFFKRSLDICEIDSNNILDLIKNIDNPLIFTLNFDLNDINKLYDGKTLLMHAIENLKYRNFLFLIQNNINIYKKDINNKDCGYYLYNYIINLDYIENKKLKIINKIYNILVERNLNENIKYDELTLLELINKINKNNKIELEFENIENNSFEYL